MPKIPAQLRYLWQDIAGAFSSRQKVIDFLKTMALVIPLTLLIWISAERAQIKEEPNVAIDLSVQINNNDQSAEILNYPNGVAPVSVTLSGPNSLVQLAKSNIGAQNRRVVVTIPDSQSIGEPTLKIADLLINSELFQGVTVTTASPAEVKVRIEPMDLKKDVPVLLQPLPVTVENIVPDPGRVDVRGPRSLIEKLFSKTGSGVYTDLDLTKNTISDALSTSGPKEFPGVKLVIKNNDIPPSQMDKISINPRQLNSLRFDIAAEQKKSGTLRSVSITFSKPSGIEKQYIVSCKKDVIYNLRITGPSDAIDKAIRLQDDPDPRQNSRKIFAQMTIQDDDKNKDEIRRKPVILNLPPGITVDQELDDIEFTLVERGNGN